MRYLSFLLLIVLASCGSGPASKTVEVDAAKLKLFKPLGNRAPQ